MKNQQIAAKVIRRTHPRVSDFMAGTKTQEVKHERRLERVEHLKLLKSRAERLARDNYCVMNWKWQGSETAFPDEPWLRTVEKYYPNAQGGPLLIDEPLLPEDIKTCERKRPYLEKQGYCYVVLEPNVDEFKDQEELTKCRGRQTQWQSHH